MNNIFNLIDLLRIILKKNIFF